MRSDSGAGTVGADDLMAVDRDGAIRTEERASPAGATRRWETPAVAGIFVLSFLVQGNAILHHGYMGQDYLRHVLHLEEAMQMQPPFWWVYAGTNPPALYWLGALIHYLTLSSSHVAVLALVFVFLNLLALWVLFKLSRAMIHRPLVRISALLALTFMPFRLIHSTVFAADALVSLPFFLVVWLFFRLLQSRNPARQLRFAALLSATLMLGLLVKFTFASTLPAALILLLYFQRNFSTRKVWAAALVLIVAVPGAFALSEYRTFANLPHDDWHPTWKREAQWRSIVFFRKADLHIFQAPSYDEPIVVEGEPRCNILISDKHSYPALLHLSIFTDIMNIFQYDPTDSYIGPRSETNQRRMVLSVKSGALWSALAFLAVAAYILRFLYLLRRDPARLARGSALGGAILLGFCLAYYANIVLCLPYVENAYLFGYWLPRLVVPALLGFGFMAFVLLDEYVESRAVHVTTFVYAIAQSCLHLSFLWPRGP